MRATTIPALRRAAWWIGMVMSAAIAASAYRYLPRVGPMPPDILANTFARPWLALHVGGAATALLAGPFQFLPGLRRRWRTVHRTVGCIYVLGCISGGIGGFVLAFGSTAGPVATAGFGLLAPIWIAATVQGWRLAMQGRYAEHREWMIRSFALTFAAVTLRLFLPVGPLLGMSFVDGYRALSFLSWIPNLIVAEAYVRMTRSARPEPGTAAWPQAPAGS
jgi:uncharacterized membrane protein